MENEVLTIDELEKIYPGGVHAVKGISFKVNRGESVAIIGSSGSGKSTGGEELKEFYLRTVKQLVDVHIKGAIIVVVGPGFLKEDFVDVGRSEAPDIFSGCIVESKSIVASSISLMNKACVVIILNLS